MLFFLLQVFDAFEVESHQQCMYDRVLAYDGLTTDAPQLGRYCGSRKLKTKKQTTFSTLPCNLFLGGVIFYLSNAAP